MGVARDWRYNGGGGILFVCSIFKLALVHHQHNNKHHCRRCWCFPAPAQRRPVRWSLVCGVMLFIFGLISLLTGHVASDIEWYSHRFGSRSWYYKIVSSSCLYFSMCTFS